MARRFRSGNYMSQNLEDLAHEKIDDVLVLLSQIGKWGEVKGDFRMPIAMQDAIKLIEEHRSGLVQTFALHRAFYEV